MRVLTKLASSIIFPRIIQRPASPHLRRTVRSAIYAVLDSLYCCATPVHSSRDHYIREGPEHEDLHNHCFYRDIRSVHVRYDQGTYSRALYRWCNVSPSKKRSLVCRWDSLRLTDTRLSLWSFLRAMDSPIQTQITRCIWNRSTFRDLGLVLLKDSRSFKVLHIKSKSRSDSSFLLTKSSCDGFSAGQPPLPHHGTRPRWD